MWPPATLKVILHITKAVWVPLVTCPSKQRFSASSIKWILLSTAKENRNSKKKQPKLWRWQNLNSEAKLNASRQVSGTKPCTKRGRKLWAFSCQTSINCNSVSNNSAIPSTQTKLSFSKGAPSLWSHTTMQSIMKTSIDSRKSRTSSSSSNCRVLRQTISSSQCWSKMKSSQRSSTSSHRQRTSWWL